MYIIISYIIYQRSGNIYVIFIYWVLYGCIIYFYLFIDDLHVIFLCDFCIEPYGRFFLFDVFDDIQNVFIKCYCTM